MTTFRKHVVGFFFFLLCGLHSALASPIHEKEALQLTLAGEDDWYPYTALKDGKLRGFSVDIIESAYAAVNVKVRFKSVPYARCCWRQLNIDPPCQLKFDPGLGVAF